MSATFARALHAARLVVFPILSLVSLAALGLNLHLLHVEHTLESKLSTTAVELVTDHFVTLNIAASVTTVLSLLAMLLIGIKKHNAFTSWVIFEISWLGLLLLFWFSTSAYTSSQFSSVKKDTCSTLSSLSSLDDPTTGQNLLPEVQAYCTEVRASISFGWLDSFIVFIHWAPLVVFAILSAKRGNAVWSSTVRDASQKL